MKIKVKELVDAMNDAPSGGFVGITDYTSEKGDVCSVVGNLGVSYGKAKEIAIADLKQAIADKDFGTIVVSGKCYWDEENKEFNSRKRSCPLKNFNIVYEPKQVLKVAEEILEGWLNPKERASNKIQLTEKENGLHFNTETGTFNFTLMVQKETYKGNDREDVKETISNPETLLKDQIRKRFEKKIKSYTIGNGKFTKLSINGKEFLSENVAF